MGWVRLGLLLHHQGNDDKARDCGQSALRIAHKLNNRPLQGRAWEGLGYLAEAAQAYQQAVILRRELGQPHLVAESLAGAARVALAQGNRVQAQAQVEEILGYLQDAVPAVSLDPVQKTSSWRGLKNTEEPLRIYLTCYRVLRDAQDPRAWGVLDAARRQLEQQAACIYDEELRHSFEKRRRPSRDRHRTAPQSIYRPPDLARKGGAAPRGRRADEPGNRRTTGDQCDDRQAARR
jgi:tetratricopeptide (TPR) repeat protein